MTLSDKELLIIADVLFASGRMAACELRALTEDLPYLNGTDREKLVAIYKERVKENSYEMALAYQRGIQAARNGDSAQTCPYPNTTPHLAKYWREAYDLELMFMEGER